MTCKNRKQYPFFYYRTTIYKNNIYVYTCISGKMFQRVLTCYYAMHIKWQTGANSAPIFVPAENKFSLFLDSV